MTSPFKIRSYGDVHGYDRVKLQVIAHLNMALTCEKINELFAQSKVDTRTVFKINTIDLLGKQENSHAVAEYFNPVTVFDHIFGSPAVTRIDARLEWILNDMIYFRLMRHAGPWSSQNVDFISDYINDERYIDIPFADAYCTFTVEKMV